MKWSKFMITRNLLIIGLLTNAATNSSGGQQELGTNVHYAPQYAIELAKKTRNFSSLHFCPGWDKPLSDPQFSVAKRIVLKIADDGKAIVNPENEEGGWSSNTIDLAKMDKATALSMWGGRPNTEGGLTFDLITEYGRPEMDIFHLDTRFANDRISSYRMRG